MKACCLFVEGAGESKEFILELIKGHGESLNAWEMIHFDIGLS